MSAREALLDHAYAIYRVTGESEHCDYQKRGGKVTQQQVNGGV